jgi:hypothetical protein
LRFRHTSVPATTQPSQPYCARTAAAIIQSLS